MTWLVVLYVQFDFAYFGIFRIFAFLKHILDIKKNLMPKRLISTWQKNVYFHNTLAQ